MRTRALVTAAALAAGVIVPVAASAGPAAASWGTCSPPNGKLALWWKDSRCDGDYYAAFTFQSYYNLPSSKNDWISSVEVGTGISMAYGWQHNDRVGCRKDVHGAAVLTYIGNWSNCGGTANDQISSVRTVAAY